MVGWLAGVAVSVSVSLTVLLSAQTPRIQVNPSSPPQQPRAPQAAAPAAPATPLEAARQQVQNGEYKQAIGQLETLLGRGQNPTESMALLMEAWLATGEYRQAAERGEAYLVRRAEPSVQVAVAEAWSRLGQYERAEKSVSNVGTIGGLWTRGKLARRKGNWEEADRLFEEVVSRAALTSIVVAADQLAVADALIELGRYQDANQIYQKLEAAFPTNATVKAKWGELMSEKHNPATAGTLFAEALEINPNHPLALLGMAAQIAESFDNKATEMVDKALAVNPNLAEARLLAARMDLEEEDWKGAAEKLDALEKINPRLLENWSLRAALAFLQNQNESLEKTWIPRILKENPRYGEVFAELGDMSVMHRLYEEAVAFYKRALEIDDRLGDARSSLGINLFRLGQEAEAKRTLEAAYERDRFNIWTVNTLRLMDSYARFDSFETDKFRVKLHQKESALLRPYVEEILKESLESLTSRYNYKPSQKVIFEMFPDHEDFAVRTLGLPGLGALGASFGPVVAMDSPSARPTGDFHWGSTLWHELAHVITLGITKNRVPRWFTEGISVYEEAHSKLGWGDPLNLGTLQALQKYGLVSMNELGGVFVRPKYPNQVVFAYFQAGMICEFIVDKFGFAKILDMLNAYAENKTDVVVFQEKLGLSLEDFDKAFREYAREKTYDFGKAVDFAAMGARRPPGHPPEPGEPPDTGEEEGHEGEQTDPQAFVRGILEEAQGDPQDFIGKLRVANKLRSEKKLDAAVKMAEEAKAMLPPYTEDGNPYELLAGIYEEQGKKEKAVAELMEWRRHRGRNPEAFTKLADLLNGLGRRKEAIQVVEDSLQVAMYDLKAHQRLGEWSLEEGDYAAAIRAFQGVLALNPPDQAAAHYHLASAYWKLHDAALAREQVLAALEIAPGYRPAQKLLLELPASE